MGELQIIKHTPQYALVKYTEESQIRTTTYKIATRLLSLKDRLHTLGFRLYSLKNKGREEIRIASSGYPVELLFTSVYGVLLLESMNSKKLCNTMLQLLQEAHRGSYQGLELEPDSIAI